MVGRVLLWGFLLHLQFIRAALSPAPNGLVKREGIHVHSRVHEGSYFFYSYVHKGMSDAWDRYIVRNRLEYTSNFDRPLQDFATHWHPTMLIFFEPNPSARNNITIREASMVLVEVKKQIYGWRDTLNSVTWSATLGNRPDSEILAHGYAVGIPQTSVNSLNYMSGSPAGLDRIQSFDVPILAAAREISQTLERYQRFPDMWSFHSHTPSNLDVGIYFRVMQQQQQPGPSRHDLLVMGVSNALVQVRKQLGLDSLRAPLREVHGFRCDIMQQKRDASSRGAVPTDTVKVGELTVTVLELHSPAGLETKPNSSWIANAKYV